MTDGHGKTVRKRPEILAEINKVLPDLKVSFMTMQDYAAAVSAQKILPQPGCEGERQFETDNPRHPLAASRRFTRFQAAERIMDLARWYRKPLPEEILTVLYSSLFDCSAAVRHSMAGILFLAGDSSSIPHLVRLLEQEEQSPAVRLRVRAALARLKGPDDEPDNVPRIIVVTDDLLLVEKLMEMADSLGAAVVHARPQTRDIMDCRGQVKIIDHTLLGWRGWNDFCDHLAKINREKDGFTMADGERDDTPLIIVDDRLPGTPPTFRRPLTRGKQYYTPVWNRDEIVRMVRELITKQEIAAD